jgi:hypothetical protein
LSSCTPHPSDGGEAHKGIQRLSAREVVEDASPLALGDESLVEVFRCELVERRGIVDTRDVEDARERSIGG